MLELKNFTPLSVSLIPALDHNGIDYIVVVIKAKFHIQAQRKLIELADEPAQIIEEDEYYGEPGKSSIKYASDLSTFKKTTDVILNGHAYSPNNKAAYTTDVTVAFDKQKYSLRVFGDRYWEKSGISWSKTNPEPFEKIELRYEKAFGGSIYDSSSNELKAFYPENPVGYGFIDPALKCPIEGQQLPNIEGTDGLINHWEDKPLPAGVGFISPNWQSRSKLAGTYDKNWSDNQKPLLPSDFDPYFFNSAHPGLIAGKYLIGEESFSLENLTESGSLSFQLPSWELPVSASIKRKITDHLPNLDTIVIEPDDLTVSLTWRATIPCPGNLLYVDYIKVGQRRMS